MFVLVEPFVTWREVNCFLGSRFLSCLTTLFNLLLLWMLANYVGILEECGMTLTFSVNVSVQALCGTRVGALER